MKRFLKRHSLLLIIKSKQIIMVVIILLPFHCRSQQMQLVESGVVKGGVVGVGFDFLNYGDTIYNQVIVPANSTIKKALLFGTNIELYGNYNVNLNGHNYTFSSNNRATNFFSPVNNSLHQLFHTATHMIDITEDISPTVQNYIMYGDTNLYINSHYSSFYLYIIFENNSFTNITYNLFLNDDDGAYIQNYNFYNLAPIDTAKPVALALSNIWFCHLNGDGSYIYVFNDSLGLVGGADLNSAHVLCSGTYANFAHFNDTIYGIGDDTPNNLMDSSDVLADISSYLSDYSTNVNLRFQYQTSNPYDVGVTTNPNQLISLSYSSPCDTFSTWINIGDTTICYGESVVLQALGGLNYQWEMLGVAIGGSNSFTVTPDSSAYYMVKIFKPNGCMKTEMAHVTVIPPLQIGEINISPTLCGTETGNIAVENISGGVPILGGAYIFSINGIPNSNISIYYNEFNNLSDTTFIISVTGGYGCTITDTVSVGYYVNTVAQFITSLQGGEAPLTVNFTNQSSNATSYTWVINKDTLSATDISYLFDTVGVYKVVLYAYGNDTMCIDSTSVLINIVSPFRVFIPTLYDANQGGLFLDTRGFQTVTLEVFDEIGRLIYVKKKSVIDGQNEFWKGDNSRGIYLYRIFAEGVNGEKLEQSGKLVLMR